MHHQGVVLADRIKEVESLAALHQVILGNDLEPVDRRPFLQDLPVILVTKAKTETQCFALTHSRLQQGSGRHSPQRHYSLVLPPASSHLA